MDGLVDTLRAAVDALAAADVDALDGAAAARLVVALESQISRLGALSARVLPTVEAEVAWAADGYRSVTAWLSSATGLPWPRARARVELGRALRDMLPACGAAVIDGEVPLDRVETVARLANTGPRRAALARADDEGGEGFLLAQARVLPAESFTRLVRRWAAAADPEADERGYREAAEREHLTLSTTTDGVHLTGFLTHDHGATLGAALGAVMGAPAPGDSRTTAQRRGQALADCARLVLDHGLVGTGSAVRPQISCVVDLATLRRAVEGGSAAGRDPGAGDLRAGDLRAGDLGTGEEPGTSSPWRGPPGDVERFAVAELLDGGPIPPSMLARLACDSEISRVVFGPESQVIDAGRAERTFSGPRRRAIIARDRSCRFPGCSAPPALAEVHHIAHWVVGGLSDVANGVLLCWHHHDHVHRHGVEIARDRTGAWIFRDRQGARLAVPPAARG